MSNIITILNGKGGCGKTTTTVELIHQASKYAKGNILAIDLDSQANLTKMLLTEQTEIGIFDCLVNEKWVEQPSKILRRARDSWPNTYVFSADRRLGVIEPHLSSKFGREYILKNLIANIKDHFEYIFIDLPPSLNILTVNSLAASNGYLIPTDLSEYSRMGVDDAISFVEKLQSKGLNSELIFLGVIVTSFHKGSSLAFKELMKDLEKDFEGKVIGKVPHSVKVAEGQKKHKPVSLLDDRCKASRAYRDIFKEVLR